MKMTLGEYTNIKLTTPDDMSVAEQILRERGFRDESDWNLVNESKLPSSCPSVDYRVGL